jgi:hypothetical protein
VLKIKNWDTCKCTKIKGLSPFFRVVFIDFLRAIGDKLTGKKSAPVMGFKPAKKSLF